MTNSDPITSEEVFEWPEFKALCKRLGVQHLMAPYMFKLDLGAAMPATITWIGIAQTEKSQCDALLRRDY